MKTRLSRLTLLKAVGELAKRDKDLAKIASTYGPPLWEREQGFHTLIHIILEQQVSLASAKAAYDRLEEAVDPLEPKNFLRLTDEELKQIGFSRQKTRYGRELANAIIGWLRRPTPEEVRNKSDECRYIVTRETGKDICQRESQEGVT